MPGGRGAVADDRSSSGATCSCAIRWEADTSIARMAARAAETNRIFAISSIPASPTPRCRNHRTARRLSILGEIADLFVSLGDFAFFGITSGSRSRTILPAQTTQARLSTRLKIDRVGRECRYRALRRPANRLYSLSPGRTLPSKAGAGLPTTK